MSVSSDFSSSLSSTIIVPLKVDSICSEEKVKYNSIYKDSTIIVEGPDKIQDHSFFLCHMNEDIANLERGIPVN